MVLGGFGWFRVLVTTILGDQGEMRMRESLSAFATIRYKINKSWF